MKLPKATESHFFRPGCHLKGPQQGNTHTRGASQYEAARVWKWSKHMCLSAFGPHKCSTAKSWRLKNQIQISPRNPNIQPTPSFLLLSLPLLHRTETLSVINPSFVLEQSDRFAVPSENGARCRFCTKRDTRTQSCQKAVISSHHC